MSIFWLPIHLNIAHALDGPKDQNSPHGTLYNPLFYFDYILKVPTLWLNYHEMVAELEIIVQTPTFTFI